jgi:hypothetical protein
MEKKARTPMNKQMKSLLYKATSLVLLGIFMCTAVFGYLSRSFGWFSDNTEVSASGMSVLSSDGLDVKAEFAKPYPNAEGGYVFNNTNDATFAAFSSLVPGDRISIYLKITNSELSPVTVNLSLAPPQNKPDAEIPTYQELPIVHGPSGTPVIPPDNDTSGNYKYHYFGSQLRINSMTLVEGQGDLYDDSELTYICEDFDRYLLRTETLKDDNGNNTNFQTTYTTKPVDFSSLSPMVLTKDFTMPAATMGADDKVIPATVIIKVEVEFVDNSKVQNAYINFGEPITIKNEDDETQTTTIHPICQRTLICTTVSN